MRSELSSRILLLSLFALISSACGGNWSNEDLEFLNALPLRSELEARVPETRAGSAGLSQQGLGRIGEEPELYSGAKRGARDANAMLFALLDLIDRVREFPPTKRQPNRRIWGPFPAEDQPGFDVRVVMERGEPGHFTWSIDFRPSGGGDGEEGWFKAIDAHAESVEGGVRRAKGSVLLEAKKAREFGLRNGDANLESLQITYDTANDPIGVHMDIVAANGEADYGYEEWSDQSGVFHYSVVADFVPAHAGLETLRVSAAWNPSGAGRAEAWIEDIEFVKDWRQVECWDAEFKAVYVENDFAPEENAGRAEDCALLTLP